MAAGARRRASPSLGLRLLDIGVAQKGLLPANEGLRHGRVENGSGADLVEIAVDQYEVRIVAGDELAFVLLGELGVGRALRVSVESLSTIQLVFRKIGLGFRFVFAGAGCKKSAKRRDRLDRIVGAEGQRHA